MSNAFFAFRQFGIRQDRCGMKVSSDACIFGAWIPVPAKHEPRVLDIGTGTGLLSLILAQRIPSAVIDAIEIDPGAAAQARENIADSIFRQRINLITGDARHHRLPASYDLIVSNPPFFSKSLRSPDPARNSARHDDVLNLETLFEIVSGSLAERGTFALLMPFDAAAAIRSTADNIAGLKPVRRMEILETPQAKPKRSCWIFGTHGNPDLHEAETVVIRDGESYGRDFRDLLDAFYLRL